DTTSLKWRLALLGGKAGEVRPALAQLAEKSPDNPYIQYYLGCADLALVEESDDPQDATDTAVRSLERASDSARNGALQERAARALSFARSLAAKESNAPKREKKKRGLINLRPGNIK
ncbi:hypothetical protein HYR69_04165, partial [Candidatus Sumerlaeota bacterium]|nr:hypothetical protein [Candidatus Sumerlaeota bacterium]